MKIIVGIILFIILICFAISAIMMIISNISRINNKDDLYKYSTMSTISLIFGMLSGGIGILIANTFLFINSGV
jgi:hypothetical protein